MKLYEIILITAGCVLFVFALFTIAFLIKKQQSYRNSIWLILIAFLMMGFTAITQAEIFGIFKYEKEKQINEIEFLTNILEYCPENKDIKEKLIDKTTVFTTTEEVTNLKESTVLSEAYLKLNNNAKAVKYADEALQKDTTNLKAKGIKKIVQTENLIKKIATIDDFEKYSEEYKTNIEALTSNPSVSRIQVNKIAHAYSNKLDSLRKANKIKNYEHLNISKKRK